MKLNTLKVIPLKTVLENLQILGATFLSAIAVVIFMLPFNIAPTGVSGVSLITNHLTGIPIGVMVLILNIPIQIIAYKMLPGGWKMLAQTAMILVFYSVSLDVLVPYLPAEGVSENMLLNALYAGVLIGISSGLVFRLGANFGGTTTLALILQRRTGIPMSNTFLYVDMFVVGAAFLVFGIEPTLYAIVTLFVTGATTDYVLEGPGVICTAMIITTHQEEVSQAIVSEFQRGATGWEAQGMYTGQKKWVLFVSVPRSRVPALRDVVLRADPEAFMIIGHGQRNYSRHFKPQYNNGKGHQAAEKSAIEPLQ